MRSPIQGAIALCLCLTFGGPGLAQQSASYVMERIAVSAAARGSSSSSFEMHITLGQEGPVGSAALCNRGFVHNTGFWSVLGYGPVPVTLRAARNTVNPGHVDLTWTGSASSFEIYSHTVPSGVVDPANLAAVTPECSMTDAPPVATIVYYVVVPAGP